MKTAIAIVLLTVGLLLAGTSISRHYFSDTEEVWTESEVEEINALSFDLHSATVRNRESEEAKEARETRLRALYAKQDDAVGSRQGLTAGLWWAGIACCLAGIGITWVAKREQAAS